MTAKNIDTKREEFRKYLEKEGVLESLTKALVIIKLFLKLLLYLTLLQIKK